MKKLSATVIVTTYNWPQALDCVLQALSEQQHDWLEVIVADDGSTDETAKVIQSWRDRFPFRLIHCWQSDQGFRAAMARNRAIALAQHDYIIFIDGDCIVAPNFVSNHIALAESGWFVAGNRVLLGQKFTDRILKERLAIHQWSFFKWVLTRLRGDCNRLFSFLFLPLGKLRKMRPLKWEGAKTCNLGVWRKDLVQINGFDESFEGWGYEDTDCVIRLQRAKIFHKSGKYSVPVYHLWHPIAKRDQEKENAKRLAISKQSLTIRALQGVAQYLVYENH